MFVGQLSFNRIISGFSLLEVLLALFISLSMITILTHHYLQRYHYFLRENTRTQNEVNALVVYQLWQDEIGRAGHIGCSRLSAVFKVKPYQQYSLTPENALVAVNNELQVRYQSLPVSKLKQWFNSRRFSMTKDVVTKKGEVMLISDCMHAEIFTVAAVEVSGAAQIVYSHDPLQYEYTEAAEIGRYIAHRYYLAPKQNHVCLVRENQAGYHEWLNCQMENLQFQTDKKGVEFHYQLAGQAWSGYAAAS